MKSTLSLAIAATALFSTANAASEPYPEKALLMRDGYKTLTYVSCYSSAGSLTLNDTYTYQTQGYCQEQCVSLTGGTIYSVLATGGGDSCYCGNSEPPSDDKVDDSYCDTPCNGYGEDNCGGTGYYSVWLTGSGVVSSASSASATTISSAAGSTKSSSSTTSATPSVVTIAGQITTITAAANASTSSSSSSSPSKSGTNKAAIAGGVVVGFALIAALALGGWLFMRHRRRREIEEEYARNAAVSSFISGGQKPPSTNDSGSFSDPRIDPVVFAQRRMSDGSIADNQDYSRRILKVTNA